MPQPFQRRYDARFGRLIPANLIAIVKAQQAGALAEVGAEYGVTLAPFIEWNTSVHKVVNVPCFTAYRRRVRGLGKEGDEQSRRRSTPVFGLVSTVEGESEDEAHDLAEMRMEVIDSIVMSAAREDIFAGYGAVSGRWDWNVTEHNYFDPVSLGPQRFRCAVEGVLEIGLLEG